jgi:hypothetical protein
MHQKVVKSATKMRKIYKKKLQKNQKSAKCKYDAKIESKFTSHRTTGTRSFRIFAFFSRRICIALPSLVTTVSSIPCPVCVRD